MQSSSLSLHCLHGFLGAPTDWTSVLPLGPQVCSYDLLASQGNLVERGQALNLGTALSTLAPQRTPDLQSTYGIQDTPDSQDTQNTKPSDSKQILVGYSLGGRIALHALTQAPERWAGAVIVSAHPGILAAADPSERKLRIKSDQNWARRFLEEDWSTLLPAWDAQPVFWRGRCEGNSDHLTTAVRSVLTPVATPVAEIAEDRRTLLSRRACADLLTSCSLGLQEDLRAKIAQLSLPILWISGQQDAKYSQIAEQMGLLGAEAVCVPGAGHRVPWEQPEIFRSRVETFLVKHFAAKY